MTAIVLMFQVNSTAQRTCSAMDHFHQSAEQDPHFLNKQQQIEEHTQAYAALPAEQRDGLGTITIPVVVHILYSNSTQNISDAQIASQMQVLNDDFRRLNSDADGTWSQAADTEIEFCMATVDPNGNATNGITRTQTSVSSFGTNDSVKFSSSGGKDAWPADQYLNMWICNIGGGILGYAQFPGGSASTDGVVMGYQYFGTIGTATSPFDGGRTTTHEVGHWLNLRHIWGDGNCNADDFVSDTPSSDGANYGCATGHVSCQTTDMVQNYMDYSDDGCMNLFTEGQKTRMRALFANGGVRSSLLTSGGCGGGGNPPPPPVTCNDNDVNISITLDNYGSETTWTLTNLSGSVVASGGPYSNGTNGTVVSVDECLPNGCYTFTINDSYGDGICCGYGNGSYTISDATGTLASGGSFASSETKQVCVGNSVVNTCTDGIQNGSETGVDCGGPDCFACPSCNDGIQNGDETGVDCGGSCSPCPSCNDGIQNGSETGVDCGGSCSACPTCFDGIQNGDETGVDCGGSCSPCGGGTGCSNVVINNSDFEAGLGIWNDGGSDCRRSINDASYAYSGNYCVRLRDNTSTSTMTTDNLNLSGFEEVTVDFTYYARSMETNEDFWLQASVDGGSSWITIVTWARGTDFNNNTRYFESVTMVGTFTSTTKFRFRADASGNSDWVYIDDVNISGCVNSAREEEAPAPTVTDEAPVVEAIESQTEVFESSITIGKIYPNPARDVLNVSFDLGQDADATITIMDIMGRTVFQSSNNYLSGKQTETINVSNLAEGHYILTVSSGAKRSVEKFVKSK